VICFTHNGGIFSCLVAGVGGPEIIHQAHRFEPLVSQSDWEEFLASGCERARFDCNRCSEPVYTTHARLREGLIQSCRCTFIKHAPGCQFRNAKEWEQFQRDFDRELLDPPPAPYWVDPVANTDGVRFAVRKS
jgi:hypothetical protein